MPSACGPDGSWDLTSPPSCHPVRCGTPPQVLHASVQLLNTSTRWQALSGYQCMPGYGDTMPGMGMVMSQCMADGSWSTVSLSCAQHAGWPGAEQKTIVSVVVISLLLLVALVIITFMLGTKKRARAAQAKKLSRIASNNSDDQKVSQCLVLSHKA